MVDAVRFAAGPKLREWAGKYGFSEWMVARYAHLTDDPGKVLQGLVARPPSYIRLNPLRAEPLETRRRLEVKGFRFAEPLLDPNVLGVRHAPMSVGATDEHMRGRTTPQDLASAAAPLALAAEPGEVVADLAAAPGIKTLHIAGDLAGVGAVVAADPDGRRLGALAANLERGGATTACVVPLPAQEVPGAAWADKVLVDAPCTGEGTLPKDRDRRRGDPKEIGRLAATQESILDAAHRILKPGGRLVYATCALAPEENEAQVDRLVQMDYRVEQLPFDQCGAPLVPGLTHWGPMSFDASVERAARFLPGIHPTLGFFVASLRKGDQ